MPCSRGEVGKRGTHRSEVVSEVAEEMKLKQRVVVLVAVLLLLGLAKLFLLDGGEGSAASRRDLRAFRKVGLCFCVSVYLL